jgi:probable rRNA maturation factor
MAAKMKAELEIQRAVESASIPDDAVFQKWVDSAITPRSHRLSLTIRVVDESEAKRLNRDFRGKDYATNVLSFPTQLPDGVPQEVSDSLLGDLLICAPVVTREAIEFQRPEAHHWAHLTIHGVLHLLGYDHVQPADAELMESLETEILAKLEIPNPYLDHD